MYHVNALFALRTVAKPDAGRQPLDTSDCVEGELKHSVSFVVNDAPVRLEVEPGRLLIQVLRDDLYLTGTKEGCSIGVCGACTVLVDGKPVSACLTLAVTLDGSQVHTIEWLSRGGTIHPLQQAFAEHGGFQCGYCTPGQIVAAYALLREHPQPTDAEIKEGMLGNLCRCTGYFKIIESIQAAANVMTEGQGVPGSPS
jgi:aerobic-type carbon monoxide dehydrogenase small subunit (CoxS/CutS family)